jgi:hypothetical protein
MDPRHCDAMKQSMQLPKPFTDDLNIEQPKSTYQVRSLCSGCATRLC